MFDKILVVLFLICGFGFFFVSPCSLVFAIIGWQTPALISMIFVIIFAVVASISLYLIQNS